MSRKMQGWVVFAVVREFGSLWFSSNSACFFGTSHVSKTKQTHHFVNLFADPESSYQD
jgi:hypothetical protein